MARHVFCRKIFLVTAFPILETCPNVFQKLGFKDHCNGYICFTNTNLSNCSFHNLATSVIKICKTVQL